MKIFPKIRLAILAVFISSPLLAQQVQPQDESSELSEQSIEKITVFGSRIKRSDLTSSSPYVTTSARDFALSGQAMFDQYLLQLPQFKPGLGSYSNNSSGGTVGQSMLNLRGLGVQRNLVLLDGHRLQSSNANSAIDINTLPSNAIGSIEVITGGASATYGSDALSGVVNFKSRTDLNGLELSLKLTQPGEGDGQSILYGIAYGTDFANSEGTFFISGEYLDRQGVSNQDRDFFSERQPSGFMAYSRTLPDAPPSQAAVDTLFASYGLSGVSNRSFFAVNDDGSLFAVSRGQASNYRGSTELPFIVTENSFGYHPGFSNYIQVPLERSAVFAKADYDIKDNISFYSHIQYADSTAENIGSAPVIAAPWSVFVPITNPYLQTNTALTDLLLSRNDPVAPVELQVRFAQSGPRTYQTKSEMWQGLLGIKGYIDDWELSWDLHLSTGRAVNTDATTSGSISYVAMQQLVDAADGGDSLCQGGYQAFNGVNQMSDECLSYIARDPKNKTVLEQTVLEGFIEAPLFELPAGESRFSIGGHYRDNRYEFTPDADIAANHLASLSATQYTKDNIAVKELFTEIYLPLMSTETIDESLNLTLGYRISDYNLSDTSHTYKAEMLWTLTDSLLLRAGFQHALRAPNVEEFFNAGTQQVTRIGSPSSGAGDPCDFRHTGLAGENAVSISELCIATGLEPSLMGSFRQPGSALVTTTYGNATLSPEEADSVSLGVVIDSYFTQDYLEDMFLTVDYYNIDIEKAIAAIPAVQSLAKCYNLDGSNPDYTVNNFFCQQFSRNSNGIFQYVNQPYLNLGGYKTSGVDVSFNWTIPVKLVETSASVTINSFINYLDSFEIAVFEDSPYQDFAGTVSSSESYPRWKFTNSLTLHNDSFSIGVKWRHFSSMQDSSIVTNPTSETEGSKSYNYLDISTQYQFTKNMALRMGVNNITDKAPTVIGGDIGTTNSGVFDTIGRTFYLQASLHLQ